MNKLTIRNCFCGAGRVAVLVVMLLAAAGVRADSQAGRFLLIFETSPGFKKNLPAIHQNIDRLFAGNLQNEIKTDDDLAVWTVDEKLHTAAYPLGNWAPEESGVNADQLNDFLEHQKVSRHASLANIQPLLNHIVKDSQQLTVLIFCDGESPLVGTPYDNGVNEIITNAVAKVKSHSFIIVLRAYHGEYLGCSVNRAGALNFPQFPKPEPVKPVVVAPPPPPPPARIVPPMIIIGTKPDASVSSPAKPVDVAVPSPAPAPATVITAPLPPLPPLESAAPAAAAPPANPAPAPVPPVVQTAPPPVASVAPPPTPAPVSPMSPEPAATPPAVSVVQSAAPATSDTVPSAPVVSTPSPAASPAPAVAAVTPVAASGASLFLLLGGVALGAALVIIIWLVVRARRPHGSLITSSMQNDKLK